MAAAGDQQQDAQRRKPRGLSERDKELCRELAHQFTTVQAQSFGVPAHVHVEHHQALGNVLDFLKSQKEAYEERAMLWRKMRESLVEKGAWLALALGLLVVYYGVIPAIRHFADRFL